MARDWTEEHYGIGPEEEEGTIDIFVKGRLVGPDPNLDGVFPSSTHHYTFEYNDYTWPKLLEYYLHILNHAGFVITESRINAILKAAEGEE